MHVASSETDHLMYKIIILYKILCWNMIFFLIQYCLQYIVVPKVWDFCIVEAKV